MMAREWKCLCPPKHHDGFLAHLYATGVTEASRIPGFLGYQILCRDVENQVEFTLTTYWDALETITAFAGMDIGVAVLYPGDEAFEIVPEQVVRHYEVVGEAFPG